MTPSSSSLADRLVAVAGRAPDAPFLLRPGRSPVAYGTLARQIRHVVDRFSDWGIAPGDVVAGTRERYIEAFRRLTGREPRL